MTGLTSVPTTRELPTKRRSPTVSFAGSKRPALYVCGAGLRLVARAALTRPPFASAGALRVPWPHV